MSLLEAGSGREELRSTRSTESTMVAAGVVVPSSHRFHSPETFNALGPHCLQPTDSLTFPGGSIPASALLLFAGASIAMTKQIAFETR